MSRGNISFGRCQSDKEWCFYGFIPCTFATDVSHPVTTFISLELVASSPFHIRQRRKSATLITVPFSVPIGKYASKSMPFKQIITFCYPGFVSTAIRSGLAIINDVRHQPLVSLTEYCGTINLMIIVGRGNGKSVLIGRLYLLINLLHPFLRNFFTLRMQSAYSNYTK